MKNEYFEQSRSYWRAAATFPINKETVYPSHGRAHNFDAHHDALCLEYGSGGGSDCLSMLRRGNYVHFVDIVPENVEATRLAVQTAGFSEKASGYLLLASDQVPLPDGGVDVISCHGVLHHIKEPLPVLAEFYRVLAPKGMLYLMLYTEIAEQFFRIQIEAAIRERGMDRYAAFCLVMDSGGPYARSYTEEEAFLLLESQGFEVENVMEYPELRGFFRTYWARKD